MGEIAQQLLSKKVYPAKGIKDIAFHISAGDYWGISITEADSEEALVRNTNMWRVAKPGFIKFIKTSPAIEIAKTIPILSKLKKDVKG